MKEDAAGSSLQTATDNRLLVIAGVEYVERSPFMVLVASNGSYIVDELLFPYNEDKGAGYIMKKIGELAAIYTKYTPNLCELQTDNRELMKLAATTAGIHVRPKRRQYIEQFTKRTLQTYAADGAIYDLYDIKPLEEPKKRSKLRTWLINKLAAALSKLQGDDRT